MPIRFVFCTALSLAIALPPAKAEPARPSGSISILPSTSRLETLWEQGEFTEGVAVAPDGQIYFSDISSSESTSGQILRFDPKTGKTTVFTAASEKSNGLMFDRDGRLIACCGANNGRMALSEVLPRGELRTLSGTFDGKRYLAPNDLVILPNGLIYFSDPRYIGNEKEEQHQMAVYRYDPFSGSVIRAIGADQIEKPNGLGLSPDGKTLYVAETNNGSTGGPNAPKNPKMGRMTLNAFPILKDGSLGTKKVLVDFGDQAGIDGMTVDTMGNVYGAVRSADRFGIVAYTPRGRELAYIPTETLPTNCCFGVGEDANTLYITAGIGLYRITMNVSGFHPATAPLTKRNDGGWVSLFDGKSAKSWTPRGEVEFLKAVNGELHLYSKKNVWVVSNAQATDFEAQLEVKLPVQAEGKRDHFNSGLGFRLIGEKGKPKGYQCEIERAAAGKNGGVYGIGFGGWLHPKGPEQTAKLKDATQGLFSDDNWNKIHIRVVGDRAQTWVNGQKISDVHGIKEHHGRLGIQHHGSGGTVKFRNLRFRLIGS
ncbi:MAG: SMP-30/gluconolactonase/LRE family protein [Verrucomicrobiota bacterium]|jgi:gluconolactonase|nr:SMP-30/gluconolactonase/LRE family protein [Verrucomicrobiota bacterium]